jgi:hypothetical protein
MPDPQRDKRAEMLRSGAARRPTVQPPEAVAEPSQAAAAGGGRARAARPAAEQQGDRFAFPKVLCRWARHLTPTQFAVALALWNRQPRQRGRAFPVSARRLGEDCGGIARNHVSEAIPVLEALGLVRVVKRGDKRRQEANEYLVPEHPPEPPTDSPARG